MQFRAVLFAFALFGAGCRSVSEPAAALTDPPLPPLPQFVLRPAWEVVPIERRRDQEPLVLTNLGDLDADGFDELAAVEYRFPKNWAWLVSGKDGSVKIDALNVTLPPHRRRDAEDSLDLAQAFVNVGDTDGDGRSDIAMSECGVDTFGRSSPSGVWLFGTDPWRILKVWRRKVDSFGLFVAPVGDVDRDGRADIATVNDYDPPTVEALSLVSEASLWRVEFPFEHGDLDEFIAIGDLDGAGCDELALNMWTGRSKSWMQCLLRGEDGAMLWSRTSAPGSMSGYARFHAANDVNGDGAPDFWALWRSGPVDTGVVSIQSGRDGSTVRQAERRHGRESASDACPDLDGDGANDLVVLWPVNSATNGYLVEVVSSRTLEPLVEFHCEDARSVAALRTPNGVRIVVTSGPALQAFDLVRVEAGR